MMLRKFVLRSLAVTSLGGVLGLVTLARDVYVGRLYGFSPEIKNYASAVMLVVILINSAGGALASSYTPFFYRCVRGAKGASLRWPLGRVFRDSAVIVIATYIGAVALRTLTGGLLPIPSSAFTGSMVGDDLALGALVLFALYSRSVIALLLAQQRYVTSALSQCMVPAASVAYLAWGTTPTSYVALVFALAFGYLTQVVFCFSIAAGHAFDVHAAASPAADATQDPKLIIRFGVMFTGALVLALLEYIEVVFASLRSAEAVAPVIYASRIVALLLGLVMTGTGNILTLNFIDIGEAVDNSASIKRRQLIHSLFVSAAIGVSFSAIAWLFADSMVRIAYAGGRFTSSELDLLATFITCYALAVPPALVGFVAGRALVASARQSSLLLGALATTITSIVCNVVFLMIGLPAISVVFASVFGYACAAALLTHLALTEYNHATKFQQST